MTETIIPRPIGIGDNNPPDQSVDYAADMQIALEGRYLTLTNEMTKLLDEARKMPAEVNDDETLGAVGKVIKDLRDLDARVEALRVGEKEPHLRRGNAIDTFFNTIRDKIARRAKGARAGAIDILKNRCDAYTQRKLAEEQERRRLAAEEAARVAREAAAKAEREAREAEEKRLAAERARKPETKDAKGAAAAEAEAAASAAQATAQATAAQAEAAYVDTLAKPAEMARTRLDSGVTVSMATEAYAQIVDREKLDKAKLWPFISDEALEKALRAWAKTTGHNQQMDGAAIGRRAKTTIR